MNNKWLRYFSGLVLTALTLWLSFRNLDWQALKESLTRVKLFWVFLGTVNVVFSVFIVSWRWQYILKSKIRVPLTDIFKVNIISQYFNILIPARFGELLKAWLLSRRHKCSGFYVLGTVVLDKMFDFFAVVLLGFFAPLFFAFRENLKGYTVAIIVLLVLTPLLVLLTWKKEIFLHWVLWFTKFLPKKFKLGEKILHFFEKGTEAFLLLKNVKVLVSLITITLVIIMSEALTNFILFEAFGFKLSIWNALVLQLILMVGMAPPSIPGKIGIFEYAVIFGLTTFGIDKSLALSCALMLHVVAYLPKIILGFIFMGSYRISIKKAESGIKQFDGEIGEAGENN
ncbi:MAG: flippase-like domain-containing protein [Acidobacteria bacterium]|jgi:hypothetical protein|nr:flippase-like domain-containing protein [Acidobacteriota bacterium]